MANIEIIVLSLAVSFIMIIIGYLTKRRGEFIRLAGFTTLIITGLVLLTTSIAFTSGTNINGSFTYSLVNGSLLLNSSSYAVQNVYSAQNPVVTNIVAFIVMLLGFFGIVDTVREMNLKKMKEIEEDDEGGALQDIIPDD